MKILGITHGISFNPAACLLVDGKLIAFAEEERFNRIKHSLHKFPINAINFCLKTAGISLKDLDAVSVGHLPLPQIYKELYSKQSKEDWNLDHITNTQFDDQVEIEGRFLKQLHSHNLPLEKLYWYDHHMAHVASSVFTSNFESCNFFSCDHDGGATAGRLGFFDGKELYQIDYMHTMGSLGYFYEEVTEKLGFWRHSEEGKTMGLASYASGKNIFEDIELIVRNKNGVYHLDKVCFQEWMPNILYVREKADQNILCKDAVDLASFAQRCLELIFIKNAEFLYNTTGCKRLAASGGCFLNCTANGKVLGLNFVDELHVVPTSTDAGNALGAAILCHKDLTGTYPRIEFNDAYWGSSFTKQQVVNSINTYNNENTRNNSSFKL